MNVALVVADNWSHSFILDHCKEYCDYLKAALGAAATINKLPPTIKEGLKVLTHAVCENSAQFPKTFPSMFCCTFVRWSDLDGMVVKLKKSKHTEGACGKCGCEHPPMEKDVPTDGVLVAIRFGHVDGHETDQPLAAERLEIMKEHFKLTTSTHLLVTPGANDRYDRIVAHSLNVVDNGELTVDVIKVSVEKGFVVICPAFCLRWELVDEQVKAMREAKAIAEAERLPLGKELAQRCHRRSRGRCGNVHLWPWDAENVRPWDHKEGLKRAADNKARGKRDPAHTCHCGETFANQKLFKRHACTPFLALEVRLATKGEQSIGVVGVTVVWWGAGPVGGEEEGDNDDPENDG